ncbi:hypothetical protein P7K49_008207 [Saguinus oedipus]|uniref:Uncharacterized protein n=1 Tax=Saguinus oedipus TaxID=9490 RepID=A0ABQ9VX28_SAGOE|nr:hypothetical protein P7K49_008207 [Saguinus oedipus]
MSNPQAIARAFPTRCRTAAATSPKPLARAAEQPRPARPRAPRAPTFLPRGRGQGGGAHAEEVGGGQERRALHLDGFCQGDSPLPGNFADTVGCGLPPPP